MFGGHSAHVDGMHQQYQDFNGQLNEAQQENLTLHGYGDIGHLDETPYERTHSDFEARFIENPKLPHHEVEHDAHGIEVVETAELHEGVGEGAVAPHMPTLPSYEELLWAYQHGGMQPHSTQVTEEIVRHGDELPIY